MAVGLLFMAGMVVIMGTVGAVMVMIMTLFPALFMHV